MSLSIQKAMSLAKAHEKKREFEQARQIYSAILGQFPNNMRARKALDALSGGQQGGGQQGGGQGIDLPQSEAQKLIGFMQQGRPDMAVKASQAIAARYPNSAFLWDITGMAQATMGRFADAEACFRKVIAIKPGFAQAHNNLGNTLKEQGQFDEAAKCFAQAAKISPTLAEAHNGLGTIYLDQEKPEEAEACFRRALKARPDYAEAHNNLGNALGEQGKTDEAVGCYQQALRYKPDYAAAHNNLGAIHQQSGQLAAAAENFSQAVKISPEMAEAHNNLGAVLHEQGRFPEAVESFEKALEISPDYAEAYDNLGKAQHELGKIDAAVESFTRAVELDPDNATAHSNLGAALLSQRNDEAAERHSMKALELKPDNAAALTNLGLIRAMWGNSDEASEYYRKAVECDPEYTIAQMLFAQSRKMQSDAPELQKMRELSASGNLPIAKRVYLEFALAKACQDLDDTAAAFAHLAEANRLRKEELGYDFERENARFADLKNTFSGSGEQAALPAADCVPAKHVPIFILGMPRSGTTLVEQIVSSHSDVHGAGELNHLNRIIPAAHRESSEDLQSVLKRVREQYLQALEGIGVDQPCITDKMPLNFRWIGYIMTALPEAKVVHMVRDPVAVCWSNFQHFFSSRGMGFTFDQKDVANYYVLYSELMEFWRDRFPGRIYDVDYRALTEDPELNARALLEHVGLEWQDDCLEFHRRKGPVRTASSGQVRKKIYKGSSEAWRRYEDHLQPMIRILDDAGLI